MEMDKREEITMSWLDKSVNENKGVEFVGGSLYGKTTSRMFWLDTSDYYPNTANVYIAGCDPYDHGQIDKIKYD